MSSDIKVKFWGVRGTVPVPGETTLKYGGNTSCVEVQCGGRRIVFDAGTGIVGLGNQNDIYNTDILLSHTHLDHIQGFPFFKPLHKMDSIVAIWAGHLKPESCLEGVMGHLMVSPVFPLTINDVNSRVEFNDFMAGEAIINKGLNTAGIEIATLPLNHPDRATAYRVTFNNKSVCYVTDVEHEIGKIDSSLVHFLKDADILIYDSTYDDDEFGPYIGWGHSTWQQGCRISEAAGVKIFVAFHHDPNMTDDDLDARAEKLEKIRPYGTGIVAREGEVIKI